MVAAGKPNEKNQDPLVTTTELFYELLTQSSGQSLTLLFLGDLKHESRGEKEGV